MTRTRIAITQRVVDASTYVERRDALAHDWHDWTTKVSPDGLLLPVPNMPGVVKHWLEDIRPSLVIVSGGNDWGDCSIRDEAEVSVLRYAQREEVPVLAVCRGLHVLNAYFGGTLSRVAPQELNDRPHVGRNHALQISADWARLLGTSTEIEVNSYHNLGVEPDSVGAELEVFAVSSDGLAEGVHHRTLPFVGVQWHPEREHPSPGFDNALVSRLLAEGAFWRKR